MKTRLDIWIPTCDLNKAVKASGRQKVIVLCLSVYYFFRQFFDGLFGFWCAGSN